jgi:hypothetical protein
MIPYLVLATRLFIPQNGQKVSYRCLLLWLRQTGLSQDALNYSWSQFHIMRQDGCAHALAGTFNELGMISRLGNLLEAVGF